MLSLKNILACFNYRRKRNHLQIHHVYPHQLIIEEDILEKRKTLLVIIRALSTTNGGTYIFTKGHQQLVLNFFHTNCSNSRPLMIVVHHIKLFLDYYALRSLIHHILLRLLLLPLDLLTTIFPPAWLGSTIIGKCSTPLITGTACKAPNVFLCMIQMFSPFHIG